MKNFSEIKYCLKLEKFSFFKCLIKYLDQVHLMVQAYSILVCTPNVLWFDAKTYLVISKPVGLL